MCQEEWYAFRGTFSFPLERTAAAQRYPHSFPFAAAAAVGVLLCADGVLVGFIGIAFVYAIQWVTTFRTGHWWTVLTLPAGGLLIVWLYRISHDQNDKGTNMVLASLRQKRNCLCKWHR